MSSALNQHAERVWLTTEEAAERLRFPTVAAFHEWLRRHPELPKGRRGRVLLFEARVLDAYVRGEAWTKRRSEPASHRGRHSVASLRVVEGETN